MMKCVVLAGSAVRIATSGVETQRAAWNAEVNSSTDRIICMFLSGREIKEASNQR
jgi:hypothetical protein